MPVKRIDVNGIPARIRTVAASAANGTGRRISACASRYQAPRSRGGRCLPAHGQRVDAWAEQEEERRQDGERDEPGERADERAGDSHRAQEPEREDRQRRDRDADRDGAERDRAAGGRDRGPDRVGAGAASRELLAIAGDEQEAVVDRETEPRARDDVQRVRRDRRDGVEQPQQEQGADDRQRTADERQQRRDAATEDDQREHEEHRKRELLGVRQVPLDLAIDLEVPIAAPPAAVPGTADESHRHSIGGLPPARLGHAGARVGRDERGTAVATVERRCLLREERLRLDDARDAQRAAGGRVAHEHEQLRRCRETGRALDERLGAQALAALRDEVVRGAAEQPRRRETERRRRRSRRRARRAASREARARPPRRTAR